MYICAISNTETSSPVVSLKSHAVFDKHVLEKYIEINGKDPINDEPMDKSEIVEISTSTDGEGKEEEAEANEHTVRSIPKMLSSFQSNWELIALEMFNLRKELDSVKKQLALALYRQDAAVDVAVGACKERDEARNALKELVKDGKIRDVVAEAPVETPTETAVASTNDTQDVVMTEESDPRWNLWVKILKEEQQKLLEKHKIHNKEMRGKSPVYALLEANKDEKYKISSTLDMSFALTMREGDVAFTKRNPWNNEILMVYKKSYYQILKISNDAIHEISYLKVKPKSIQSKTSFWMNNNPYVITVAPPLKTTKSASRTRFYLTNIRDASKTSIETDSEIMISDITLIEGHPTSSLLLVISKNFIDVVFDKLTLFIQKFNSNIKSVRFHPDGVLIAISYEDTNAIDIYDLSDRQIKLRIEWGDSKLRGFEFSINGYSLFITTDSELLHFDMRKTEITLRAEIGDNTSDKIFMDETGVLVVANNRFIIFDPKCKSILDTARLGEVHMSEVSGIYSNFDAKTLVLLTTEDCYNLVNICLNKIK